MFNNNPLSSKTEQLTQHVYEPVKVPVIVGNDVYILLQQDIRNVIDTRHVSCIKCPNGLKYLQDYLMQINQNAIQQQQLHQGQIHCIAPQQVPQCCVDLFNNAASIIQQQYQQYQLQASSQNSGHNGNIASLQTQIDWAMKDCQAVNPDQFTYTKVTSTTDLREFNCRSECNRSRPYNPRPIIKILISKGTNTTAAELVEELERQKDESPDQTPPPSALEVRKEKRQKSEF